MSRLGRDKQRDQQRAERPPAPVPVETPIDVRVPEAGTDARGASVDGVLVVPAPGEEVRHAVLNRLHRFALTAGRPVLATIHDDRIGCVVQLRVDPDGSSHLAAKPVPTPRAADATPPTPEAAPASAALPTARAAAPAVSVPPASPAPEAAPASAASPTARAAVPAVSVPPASPAPEAAPASAALPTAPAAASSAPLAPAFPPSFAAPTAPPALAVRASASPATPKAVAPAARVPVVPEPPRMPSGGSVPTFVLRALPEATGGVAPGTVVPPTGVFGPPPRMDAAPAGGGVDAREAALPAAAPRASAPRASAPSTSAPPASAPRATAAGAPAPPVVIPGACEAPVSEPASVPGGRPEPVPGLLMDPDPAPRPTPTPPRGFDAVAEAVLGDAPITAPGDATAPALLAEPTARINDAVKEGRTQDAARLAERSVAEASETLGPEHPEVLRLRELTAYIAYLSGDPGRAFELSVDLARIHRTAGDAEAAYGNVQSAATAWRAVRDPERGLELGRDLVGLWSELAAEAGPAADDAEQLEAARTRMGRLAGRARAHARAD
ncbi:tetratricopeptide repeat protein [Streptomyces sp. NPDC048193]|uniref:tetratricopeptide repeat protein n=1 Tax=unclassified Streptomyces TaxID=2593676 RepID=UPI00341DA5BC